MSNDNPSPNEKYRQAYKLQSAGRYDEAEPLYRELLTLYPDHANVNALLGHLLIDTARAAEAIPHFETATAKAPDNIHAALGLARASEVQKDLSTALLTLNDLLRKCPENADVRKAAEQFAAKLTLSKYSEIPEAFFESIVRIAEVNPHPLRGAVQSLLKAKPSIARWISMASMPVTDLEAFSQEELFLTFMSRTPITDLHLEHVAHGAREAALRALDEKKSDMDWDAVTPIYYAVARQCLLNEYLYHQSDVEQAGLSRLEIDIRNLERQTPTRAALAIVLLAAFRPLHRHPALDEIQSIAKRLDNADLNQFLEDAVDRPRQEMALAEDIPTLGLSDDTVSKAVRAQYEDFPYPRWQTVGRPKATSFRERLATELRGLPGNAGDVALSAPDVLIAGCGTGRQCVLSAESVDGARVTAMDLSRSSLAYAVRKTRELGIDNIEFLQADILALQDWDRRFDIIECTGVLHHMADPQKGWETLLNLLRPGGFMKVGLYSEAARKAVTLAREDVARQGFEATADGIREYRRHVTQLSADAPDAQIQQSSDFYSLSACRDLVFHAQEHQFTIPQLKDILASLNLEFLGFQFPQAWQIDRFDARFKDRPNARTNLNTWELFEDMYPTAFGSMYMFWCRKRG